MHTCVRQRHAHLYAHDIKAPKTFNKQLISTDWYRLSQMQKCWGNTCVIQNKRQQVTIVALILVIIVMIIFFFSYESQYDTTDDTTYIEQTQDNTNNSSMIGEIN